MLDCSLYSDTTSSHVLKALMNTDFNVLDFYPNFFYTFKQFFITKLIVKNWYVE